MNIKSKLRTKFKHEPLHLGQMWYFDSDGPVIVYNKGGLIHKPEIKNSTNFRFGVEAQTPQFRVKVPNSEVQVRKYSALSLAMQKLIRTICRYENNIYKKLARDNYQGYWVTYDKMTDPEITVINGDKCIEIYAWYKIGAFVMQDKPKEK